MSDYTIYHNSWWGKSRATLQLLRDSNIEPNIINYLTETLSVKLLTSISDKLGAKPSSWIRKNENEFKINNINDIIDDYYKNKIRENRKNLITKKLNIESDLNIIYGIIRKFYPIIIYYFPTPKIYFKTINDINLIEQY